jgi:hypothetical protein
MPDVIKATTNADSASALVAALAPSLTQAQASEQGYRATAEQLITAVDETFAGYEQDATELAEAFSREATDFEASRQEFTTLLEARIRKLEGPDGAIAKAQSKIATAREAIEADVQAVVSDAQNTVLPSRRLSPACSRPSTSEEGRRTRNRPRPGVTTEATLIHPMMRSRPNQLRTSQNPPAMTSTIRHR